MGLLEYADKIQTAVFSVLKNRNTITKDLGGNSSTKEYTNAIIDSIR